MKRTVSLFAFSLITAISVTYSAQAQVTFTNIGILPGGSRSFARSVSSDGSVVVGSSPTAGGLNQAFRWTSAGLVDLGTFFGATDADAFGVSGDGNTIVGSGRSSGVNQALTGTTAGLVSLGPLLGGVGSVAYGISEDGNTTVGTSGTEAFRLNSSGVTGLGTLAGYAQSNAYDASSDGSVVVGNSTSSNNVFKQAFRWTPAGGMVGLGFLPGGDNSTSFATSSDGSVIVGNSGSINLGTPFKAFRWTSAGMIDLGTLVGGTTANALGVSGDGSVVVGSGSSTTGTQAFFWNQTDGMVNLRDTLLATGTDLTGWTVLTQAQSISVDGTTIVGFGFHNGVQEAFIARSLTGWTSVGALIPEPNTMALLALGGAFGIFRRRKNSSCLTKEGL
jgi:probable HAF family extracellular repeat protein